MANLIAFADDAVRVAIISYNNPYQDPNDDLSSYGPGRSYVKTSRRMRKDVFANNWDQLQWSTSENLWGVSQVAFSSARVGRGEVLPTFVGTSSGIASFPALTAVMNPITRFFLPAVFGTAGTAVAASMLAVIPAYGIGRAAASSVIYVKDWGYRLRHIELGGDYKDTETAYNLRMRTVSEMSSAQSYSRRWLGNEALYMR